MVGNRLRKLIPDRSKQAIKAFLGVPRTRIHMDWSILKRIGPIYSSHQIVDVGAHHGWFFHCWLDWCPAATVHAFEPFGESFDRMKALYGDDHRVHMNRSAVGAESGESELNVLTDSKVSSSFLAPERSTWDAIEYHTGAIEQERVPVVTLDQHCAENSIESVYLIKVDVQGFEIEVLKGAGRVLGNTNYVFVEAGIERLYEGAPSFAELHLEMEKQGFHLMTMRAWHRGNHRLVEADMLFRRNGLEPDIDRDKERYYVELK